MPGRHQMVTGLRPRLRWLVGGAALLVAAATSVALFPASAGAATTVNAQLSLTGVATKSNVTGGRQIGIHPGDTVNFEPATVPTAGLEALGLGGLVSTLDSLLGGLTGYQIVLHLPAGFPGGKRDVKLGTCGKDTLPVRFPAKGTYDFTWSAYSVSILCTPGGTSLGKLDGNQLKNAGVALNASNNWAGRIVVSDDPPKGGISVQLPGISVAPKIAGHQLPTVGVSPVNLPTITTPDIKLPTSGNKSPTPRSGGNTNNTPTVGGELPVPAQIVPRGSGGGYVGTGGYVPNVLPGSIRQIGSGSDLLPVSNGGNGKNSNAPTQLNSTGKKKTVDLASSKASTGQLSVILAIIAVIVLSMVSAMYARLYLLRR